MDEKIKTILKQYHVNITTPRVRVLEAFMENTGGLDYNYFMHKPAFAIDRTTVFRTLNLFVKRKIIYRVADPNGVTRYLLQPATQSRSIVEHSSFICSICRRVVPLDTLKPPKIRLPGGFIQENIEIIINGLCDSCKSYV